MAPFQGTDRNQSLDVVQSVLLTIQPQPTWNSWHPRPLCQMVRHQVQSLVEQRGQKVGLSGAGSPSSWMAAEQRGLGQ
jgi:hypothetical protein